MWHSPKGNFTGNAPDIYLWYEFEKLVILKSQTHHLTANEISIFRWAFASIVFPVWLPPVRIIIRWLATSLPALISVWTDHLAWTLALVISVILFIGNSSPVDSQYITHKGTIYVFGYLQLQGVCRWVSLGMDISHVNNSYTFKIHKVHIDRFFHVKIEYI